MPNQLEALAEEPNDWLDRLYPDVVRAGGPAELLLSLISPPGASLKISGARSGWSASVATLEPQLRQTTVNLGNEERVFIVEARIERAHLGLGSAESLDTVVGWIEDFHSVNDVEYVIERHPFVRTSHHGSAYLSRSEVDWWWDYLLDPPPEHSAALPRLRDLITAAAQEPQLRQLLPVTSHDDLHFSRCTRYPFSEDLPSIRTYAVGQAHYPSEAYQYEVNAPGRQEPFAADTAEEAAAIAAHGPESCDGRGAERLASIPSGDR